MSMAKKWDVTIMKMGSIQIEAETEEEAIEKAERLALMEDIFQENYRNIKTGKRNTVER